MTRIQKIDTQIINYLNFLSIKEKQAVLSVVKTFAEDETDIWDEIKASVKIGLEESKNGLGISHEQAMKKYKKWLKK